MDEAQLIAAIEAVLRESQVMGLATTDEAGLPYGANVRFVVVREAGWPTCLFLSGAESAHSRHAAQRPTVAATAYPAFEEPGQIRGVQMRGRLIEEPAERFEANWRVFVAEYPAAAPFEERARSQRFYRLTPSWLRLIDNRVRFGFKQETRRPQ
jgi:uncharacterized protein YhbP (UPF0306 family)